MNVRGNEWRVRGIPLGYLGCCVRVALGGDDGGWEEEGKQREEDEVDRANPNSNMGASTFT